MAKVSMLHCRIHWPDSIPVKKKSQMTASKSMHGFYNRTWNERSLSKYANEHNYENVYNNHGPNYENVYFGGGGYEAANSADSSCEGCVISQLTCSPRSARARLTQYVISPCSLLLCTKGVHDRLLLKISLSTMCRIVIEGIRKRNSAGNEIRTHESQIKSL